MRREFEREDVYWSLTKINHKHVKNTENAAWTNNRIQFDSNFQNLLIKKVPRLAYILSIGCLAKDDSSSNTGTS